MVRFQSGLESAPLTGALLYRSEEYSFDFVPESAEDVRTRAGSRGTTSLLLGTLQLETGVETGLVLFPWGFHPKKLWRSGVVTRPIARPGTVRAVTSSPLEVGVSLEVDERSEWLTWYDPRSTEVCFRRDGSPEPSQLIEFATGAVAGIVGGELVGIWLRPQGGVAL